MGQDRVGMGGRGVHWDGMGWGCAGMNMLGVAKLGNGSSRLPTKRDTTRHNADLGDICLGGVGLGVGLGDVGLGFGNWDVIGVLR